MPSTEKTGAIAPPAAPSITPDATELRALILTNASILFPHLVYFPSRYPPGDISAAGDHFNIFVRPYHQGSVERWGATLLYCTAHSLPIVLVQSFQGSTSTKALEELWRATASEVDGLFGKLVREQSSEENQLTSGVFFRTAQLQAAAEFAYDMRAVMVRNGLAMQPQTALDVASRWLRENAPPADARAANATPADAVPANGHQAHEYQANGHTTYEHHTHGHPTHEHRANRPPSLERDARPYQWAPPEHAVRSPQAHSQPAFVLNGHPTHASPQQLHWQPVNDWHRDWQRQTGYRAHAQRETGQPQNAQEASAWNHR